MNQNFLISTPIQSTWPELKKNNLIFSSESALLSIRGPQNKYDKFTVNPSRWNNKIKLEKDYDYINNLYEELLVSLSKHLNFVHGENKSINFWRILIGPWLGNFLHVYFERWINIEQSFSDNKIDKVIFLKLNSYDFIPYDDAQFLNFCFKDYWNQFIYQQIIINFIEEDKISFINYNSEKLQSDLIMDKPPYTPSNIYPLSNINKIKVFLKKIFQYLISNINIRNNQYFFYKTFFGFKDEIKLNLIYKQCPILHINKPSFKQKSVSLKMREKINFSFLKENKFEKSLNKLLAKQIPSIFLENYNDLKSFYENINLPKKPKVIFTSNSAWFDTNVAYYLARSKELNAQFIYGQHGGNYGIAKILWPEKHEIKISDKFLTWGWKEKDKKILPLYMFKKINIKKKTKENLLVMLKNRQRYFFSMDSSAGTDQHSGYIKYCSDFLFNLKDHAKKDCILRLPLNIKHIESNDFFSNLEGRFNFKSDNSLIDAFSKSGLIVHTLLSTSINEALSANLPSIIILRKNNNPFRDEAISCMKLLYENNILFYDSTKAANFINSIWKEGLDNWWNKKETQNAVRKFCNNFATKKSDSIKDLKGILK